MAKITLYLCPPTRSVALSSKNAGNYAAGVSKLGPGIHKMGKAGKLTVSPLLEKGLLAVGIQKGMERNDAMWQLLNVFRPVLSEKDPRPKLEELKKRGSIEIVEVPAGTDIKSLQAKDPKPAPNYLESLHAIEYKPNRKQKAGKILTWALGLSGAGTTLAIWLISTAFSSVAITLIALYLVFGLANIRSTNRAKATHDNAHGKGIITVNNELLTPEQQKNLIDALIANNLGRGIHFRYYPSCIINEDKWNLVKALVQPLFENNELRSQLSGGPHKDQEFSFCIQELERHKRALGFEIKPVPIITLRTLL